MRPPRERSDVRSLRLQIWRTTTTNLLGTALRSKTDSDVIAPTKKTNVEESSALGDLLCSPLATAGPLKLSSSRAHLLAHGDSGCHCHSPGSMRHTAADARGFSSRDGSPHHCATQSRKQLELHCCLGSKSSILGPVLSQLTAKNGKKAHMLTNPVLAQIWNAHLSSVALIAKGEGWTVMRSVA